MATGERSVAETKILEELERSGVIEDTQAWAHTVGLDHAAQIHGAVLSLETAGSVTQTSRRVEGWELTADGERVLAEGSPESRFLHLVASHGAAGIKKEEAVKSGLYESGYSEAMKNRWISYNKAADLLTATVAADVEDTVRRALSEIKGGRVPDAKEQTVLKTKRKFIALKSHSTFKIEKGPMFGKSATRAGDLTVEMLRSGSWKETAFKQYNCSALGAPTEGGYLHPLTKVRTQFRQIFLEMGFEEMPTNQYVESSFWNFDSLFQPQQHPARDMHDTFFMKDPKYASDADCPADYLERVKKMHEVGGNGSIGWRYDWSLEESRKNILRTHTTAVSSRVLYKLAQQPGGFKPVKCFSIDRVFRNETLDATHLAEFHQVEGFIADYNIGLPHLIHTLTTFFDKLGLRNLRFKPAFNPYTEPSMEIFCYHPKLKRTIEVGNSGVFRPEMLQPMGLPEGVQVIAWGLSLERPTMIMYGVESIRSLFGPSCSLESTVQCPVCPLDP
eukprot:m51a1_g13923 putative phenylalanyl-tRNA synthetase (503) ;mRNA; r:819203-821138